ncbi:MAG: hypothetical protein SPJ34_02715 [Candidatus Ornithospirochaeta sp.]|nr:hypothetical protein [Candidatus Ornithospirochaeta sp.]
MRAIAFSSQIDHCQYAEHCCNRLLLELLPGIALSDAEASSADKLLG